MPTPNPKKAVALLSGGLDSTLAAKIMKDQGIELIGLYLSAPWGCCDVSKATSTARTLGIPFRIEKLTKDYITVIRNPKYGYGSSMNPCVDCRIHMFEKASRLMEEWGASFMVTGEVVGQRPMSQMRRTLKIIENDSRLTRRVLRPLSAKVLEPTIPEEQGAVDRSKLYGITGRSRKIQMKMAADWGIVDYPTPAGGCLLTDKQFGDRVRDLYRYQKDIDLDDMELLRLGRLFRVDATTKIIVGRDERENRTLEQYIGPGRAFLNPEGFLGPAAMIVGMVSETAKARAVQLIVRYTREDKRNPQGSVLLRTHSGEEHLPVEVTTDEALLEKARV